MTQVEALLKKHGDGVFCFTPKGAKVLSTWDGTWIMEDGTKVPCEPAIPARDLLGTETGPTAPNSEQ